MKPVKKRKRKFSLDWGMIWGHFDDWIEEDRSVRCSKCKRTELRDPDWPDQQDKIMDLVEQELDELG